MEKLNEYIKIAEAARIVGVSQNTLRLWAEAGKLPVHRNPANNYRLFRRQDLEAFLADVAATASREATDGSQTSRGVTGTGMNKPCNFPN